MVSYITPNWPVPKNINACTTTREGGVSAGVYKSLNLALHVDDNSDAVRENRRRLSASLNLPSEPVYLNQVHSTKIINVDSVSDTSNLTADASFTQTPHTVCSVMTADCLPILVCDKKARFVMAIHAGWRGLLNGIIEHSIAQITCNKEDILVWLGPAIGPNAYEVDDTVRNLFIQHSKISEAGFLPTQRQGHWLMNIYHLAKLRLNTLQISAIYGGEYCTYSSPELFYSYRRDHITGRMASCIWIED